MADETTVLLVGDGDPDTKLFEQLEKKDLAVEISALKEFPSLLALVEPHLVIHVGRKGAEDTVRILKETEEVRRVRLVLVAGRTELEELRKLDRSVVISMLADDIAPAVVAARVQMLAKKGPEKSVRPPSRMAKPAPPEPAPPKAAAAAPLGSAKAAAGPPKAAAPKALGANKPPAAQALASATSTTKVAPAAATPASGSQTAIPRAEGAVLPRPALSKGPAAPVAAAVAKPLVPRAVSKAATPPPPAAAKITKEPAAPTPKREDAAPPPPEFGFGFDDESAEELTVAFDAPVPVAARPPSGPHVLVADVDMTRADFVACALRESGIEARITPLDAAQTHWALVREFHPTIVLGDAAAFKGPGQIWLQLFQADHALRSAKIVPVPFDRLFNLDTGKVNLRTLIPHIPQLSGEIRNEAQPTRGPTPVPPETAPVSEANATPIAAEAPRPALDDDEEDDEFERMTVTHSVEVPDEARASLIPPQNNEGILADRTRQKSIADIEDLEVLGPRGTTPASDLSPAAVPHAAPHRHTSRSAPTLVEGSRRLSESAPPKKSAAGKYIFIALLVALGGAGTWLAMGNPLFGFSIPSMKGPAPGAAPTPAQSPAPPVEPKQAQPEEKAPAEPPADPLWVIPAAGPPKTCEELVKNLEALRPGGIPQATMSLNRARQKMVLGNLDEAQVLMCEAVLLHPETMALEELSALYVTRRQGELARKYIDMALALRKERSKTLEAAGDVASIEGKADEAKKFLAGALNVSPDEQKTLDAVAKNIAYEADIQFRGGALPQAELLYRRAATLSPTNVAANAGMAACHAGAGQTEGAQLWAERTLNLDPENAVALVVQAGLATEGGDTDRAIELCKRALKRDPVYGPAHQLLKQLEGN